MTRLPLKKVRVQNNTEHNLYLSHQKELRLLPNIFIGLLTVGSISAIVLLWHTNGSAFFKEQMNLVQMQQHSLNTNTSQNAELVSSKTTLDTQSSSTTSTSKTDELKDALYTKTIQDITWFLTLGCQENNTNACSLYRIDPVSGKNELIVSDVRAISSQPAQVQINFAKTQSEPTLILVIAFAQNNSSSFELIKIHPITQKLIASRTVKDTDQEFLAYRS